MMNSLDTWAIIQARMGSTRLPGKIVRPLAGIPALVHVIERAKAISGVSRVIVATSVERDDDTVADLVWSWFDDVELVRGPEDDVLRRFTMAVGDEPPEFFVRITGDSPLLSFEHTSTMLDVLIDSGADGVDAHHHNTGLTTGLGAEIYRTETLLAADDAADPGPDREHVTTWIKRNPEYQILYPRPLPELTSDFRVTLDYPQDYEVLKCIYDELYKPGQLIESAAAVDFLRRSADVRRLNQDCVHNVVR